MRETSEEKIRERRQNLIRAADARPTPEFEPLLEKSNADDLEWLRDRLNAQIAEANRRVDGPEESIETRARRRANRNAAGEALRKRRITDLQEMRRRGRLILKVAIATLVVAVIGTVATIIQFF